jgi:hypothetical protein
MSTQFISTVIFYYLGQNGNPDHWCSHKDMDTYIHLHEEEVKMAKHDTWMLKPQHNK